MPNKGFLGIAGSWWFRWRRIRAAVRAGSPLELEIPIRAISSPTLLEPSAFGVLRPVLLLPEGIFDRLTQAQLKGIIAHELCHLGHRDNLIAAIHMFVETVFWFYPLVWWIGKRMVEERERACDEEVLRLGSEPRVYAEGILNVCKLYLESPLVCVSGVTGSNLKKRIEAIMSNRDVLKLNFTRKAALAVAGVAALVLPTVVGVIDAPFVHAQSSAAQPKAPNSRLTFDVASVKPASVPAGVTLAEGEKVMSRKGSGIQVPRNTGGPGTDDPGRIHYPLISLKALLRRAWESSYEIEGPSWLASQAVAVDATMPPNTTKEQFQEMLRNLITDRFGLKYHTSNKEVTGYALVIAGDRQERSETEGVGGPGRGRVGAPPAADRQGQGRLSDIASGCGEKDDDFGYGRPQPHHRPTGADTSASQEFEFAAEDYRYGCDWIDGEIRLHPDLRKP
jgi:uncharacterized protein (TIGR03435 family)